jgi:putative DNA-invertase from lambdoid prophage Rac
MATFGYARVSTHDQTTANQRQEIERSGYAIDYGFADEGVSGSTTARDRPKFKETLGKIHSGESPIVSKIDPLGRDALDIQKTVKELKEMGVRVHVVQLGGTDLTSAAGKMLLAMLAAFAEMERDLIVERTNSGLARAKAQGKKLARPAKTTAAQRDEVRAQLAAGESVSTVARLLGIAGRQYRDTRRGTRCSYRCACTAVY